MGKIAVYFFVGTLLFLNFSCTHEEPSKQFKIGLSQCTDDAWRTIMEAEMARELAFHPEIEFVKMNARANSQLQIQQVRELAASGIDLLLVSPNESEPLTPILDEVYNSGIPVVLIDRKTDSDSYTAYIGADNYEIGKTAALYIADKFSGEGKIIELQFSFSISAGMDRHSGFIDALKKYPELEVVDAVMGEDIETFIEEFPSNLKKNPDAQIFFGFTDLLAETAFNVAQKEGVEEGKFFVGVDGVPGTGRGIQAVEDGILDASMLYPTGGKEAIRLALSVLNNLPFEKRNMLQTVVIDQSNARILNNQFKKVNDLQKDIDLQQARATELNANYERQRFLLIILVIGLVALISLGGVLFRLLWLKQRTNRQLAKVNKEVVEKQEELLRMSDELKEATDAKMTFFTNISHEFRTPLTLILAFAEDIIPYGKKLPQEVFGNVKLIRENGFRLLRLVNQLMDFRKVESDRMRIRISENDLIEFVRNLMISYFKIAEKRKIDFELVTRHEELNVWFDPNMLDKILFNILSNAFKFTPDEGKISVFINVDHFENLVKIKVEDSGKGMSKKDAKHAFDRFYQGEDNRHPGTGIGLPLSLALAKLHGGDILLKTKKDKGSRFTVLLLLGKDHFQNELLRETKPGYFSSEELLIQSEEAIPLTLEPDSKNEFIKEFEQSVLIIEDNEDLLNFLNKKLSERYETFASKHGDRGLEIAFEKVPDLIVCDINLPGQDGLEITQTLKSDIRTSHIPVLLLTARGTVEQQIEGTKAGADAYIVKPFHIGFLQEQIRNLIHNRQILKEAFSNEILELKTENKNFSEIDRNFIQKFTGYISRNYTRQNFQVNDLCDEMNLSRSQLYRKVKALLGMSISDYIQQVRLEKAAKLLTETEATISEIAYQIGYTSPDYFSSVFKSKYNVTPTRFKKEFSK